ncbi:MAG: hypothetical protein JWN95_3560 [Frankiales bacterium]|nr:hypothetical protein [Frankiales bacterium]
MRTISFGMWVNPTDVAEAMPSTGYQLVPELAYFFVRSPVSHSPDKVIYRFGLANSLALRLLEDGTPEWQSRGMATNKQRYMDWDEAPDDGNHVVDDGTFEQSVVAMPTPHSVDRWHAVWSTDANNGFEEFEGSKDEVVTWSIGRCKVAWIWSDEKQDVERR